MGATTGRLARMTLLQAAVVGTTGYGLGMGVLSLFFRSLPEGRVPLIMRWEVAAFVFAAVTLIICFASFIGIRRVARIEPAIVFRS
jgi:putative ABC transport system permease protein